MRSFIRPMQGASVIVVNALIAYQRIPEVVRLRTDVPPQLFTLTTL